MMPQTHTGVKKLLSYAKKLNPELDYSESIGESISVSYYKNNLLTIYFGEDGYIEKISVDEGNHLTFAYGDYIDYLDRETGIGLYLINEDESPDAQDILTFAIFLNRYQDGGTT